MIRYRPTHLWAVLEAKERDFGWLARKANCTRQYLSLLHTGRREAVSKALAERIAAVLDLPVQALFAPIESTQVVDKSLHVVDNSFAPVDTERVAD